MVDVRLAPGAFAGWGCSLAVVTGLMNIDVAVALGAIAVLASLGAAVSWARDRSSRVRPGGAHALTPGGSLRLGCALVGVCACGCLWCASAAMAAHLRDPLTVLADEGVARVEVVAQLAEDPAPMRQKWAAGVSMANARVRLVGNPVDEETTLRGSRVQVLLQGRELDGLTRGDVIEASGTFDTSFRSDPPSVGTMTVTRLRLLERPGGWAGAVRVLRRELLEAVRPLSGQARALVPGMAVGDDRALTEDLHDAMVTASLTHLTAVSGSHVAILMGVVTALVPGRGVGRATATLVAMAGLVTVVGPEPSVLRSVATGSVAVVGLLTRRPGQARAALCAVALVTVLLDPFAVRSLGFALSVVATWAVIGPAASWSRALRGLVEGRRGEAAMGHLIDVVTVPLAAQILVAPILVLINPWIPIWGVAANILVAPAVAPASLLGTGAAMTAWWWPAAGRILARGAGIFTGWIATVAVTTAGWPGARLNWPGGVGGSMGLTVTFGAVWLMAVIGSRAGSWRAVRGWFALTAHGDGTWETGAVGPSGTDAAEDGDHEWHNGGGPGPPHRSNSPRSS